MIIGAKVKHIGTSQKKLRRIVNLIRNKSVPESLNILKFLNIANKKYVVKLLESVQANAKIKDPDVKLESLMIVRIVVDGAAKLKRMRPRARGRADIISRRMSHITLDVEMPESEKGKKKKIENKK